MCRCHEWTFLKCFFKGICTSKQKRKTYIGVKENENKNTLNLVKELFTNKLPFNNEFLLLNTIMMVLGF